MMAKTTQTEADEIVAGAHSDLVNQVVWIMNMAPIDKDAKTEDEGPHRGNSPWLIAIPVLKICFTAQRRDGTPICGFYEDQEALALAARVYDKCRSDAKVLDAMQKDYRWPETFVLGHKIMQRIISVQPMPVG